MLELKFAIYQRATKNQPDLQAFRSILELSWKPFSVD